MSQYSVLAARLHNELERLNKVVQTAEAQTAKAQQTKDVDFSQAAALSLQNYYMGVERIFEEVAKRIDQSLPSGPSSHQELLEQMGLEIPHTRPPLLSASTLTQINKYRAFRHVVMHRYGFELQPERVSELVAQLSSCHALLTNDLQSFYQFLVQLDQAL